MKILYITVCWTGLEGVLFDGKSEAEGMPAFIKPLKKLVDSGHEIDMYVIHSKKILPRLNIKAEWAKKINLVGFSYYATNLYDRVKSIWSMRKDVHNILRNSHYDFIYAHGSAPGVLYNVIKKSRIPYGHRLYGTFLYDEMKKYGYKKAKYKHYIEYTVFKRKKDFLLITDDGSKGDKVFEIVNPHDKPCRFEFWINGANKVAEGNTENKYIKDEKQDYLFYLARISRWKGQHRAIELIKLLKDKGYEIKLYLSGQVFEEDYYQELLALAKDLGVENQVVFTGAINSDIIKSFAESAVASLSFYDLSNRGNVFYEYLSAGAVVISLDDGSLNDFIVNKENGFLVKNMEEACDIVEQLRTDSKLSDSIRNCAQETFKHKLKTWDERVIDEINLIESYVESN